MSNKSHRTRIARQVSTLAGVSHVEALRQVDTALRNGLPAELLHDPTGAAQWVLAHPQKKATRPSTALLGYDVGVRLGTSHGTDIWWDGEQRFTGELASTILHYGDHHEDREAMKAHFRFLLNGTVLRPGPMVILAPRGDHWSSPQRGVYAPGLLPDHTQAARVATNFLHALTRATWSEETLSEVRSHLEGAYQEHTHLTDVLGSFPLGELRSQIMEAYYADSGRLDPVDNINDQLSANYLRRGWRGPLCVYWPVHLELPPGPDTSQWTQRDWAVHALHLTEVEMSWEFLRETNGGVLQVDDANALSWSLPGRKLLQRLARSAQEAGILLILDAHEGLAPGTLQRNDVGEAFVNTLSRPESVEFLGLASAPLSSGQVLYRDREGRSGTVRLPA